MNCRIRAESLVEEGGLDIEQAATIFALEGFDFTGFIASFTDAQKKTYLQDIENKRTLEMQVASAGPA